MANLGSPGWSRLPAFQGCHPWRPTMRDKDHCAQKECVRLPSFGSIYGQEAYSSSSRRSVQDKDGCICRRRRAGTAHIDLLYKYSLHAWRIVAMPNGGVESPGRTYVTLEKGTEPLITRYQTASFEVLFWELSSPMQAFRTLDSFFKPIHVSRQQATAQFQGSDTGQDALAGPESSSSLLQTTVASNTSNVRMDRHSHQACDEPGCSVDLGAQLLSAPQPPAAGGQAARECAADQVLARRLRQGGLPVAMRNKPHGLEASGRPMSKAAASGERPRRAADAVARRDVDATEMFPPNAEEAGACSAGQAIPSQAAAGPLTQAADYQHGTKAQEQRAAADGVEPVPKRTRIMAGDAPEDALKARSARPTTPAPCAAAPSWQVQGRPGCAHATGVAELGWGRQHQLREREPQIVQVSKVPKVHRLIAAAGESPLRAATTRFPS